MSIFDIPTLESTPAGWGGGGGAGKVWESCIRRENVKRGIPEIPFCLIFLKPLNLNDETEIRVFGSFRP